MGISHYLAMTAEEIASAPAFPERLAYMACHFSPYGTGLTEAPKALPENAMLILNDRIPFCGHDEALIARQLEYWAASLRCHCLLLDFQRPDTPRHLGQFLVQSLSLPVGIAADFAEGLKCPVFLPPVPPDIPLAEYTAPWTGREIWLETDWETLQITVDTQGSHRKTVMPEDPRHLPFANEALCCHYKTEVFSDRAVFTLQRTPEDLQLLLEKAQALGITTAVGLYQQMKKLPVQ